MKCVYCEKELTEENKSCEHIIPQALGGLLKSSEICCKECNSALGTNIDKKFTDIFSFVTESYSIKTDRKKAQVKHTGTVMDVFGKIYRASFNGKELKSIFDFEKNTFIKKITEKDRNEYVLVSLDIKIENNYFSLGMIKIAFNYAIMCGLNKKDLELVFDINGNKIKNEKKSVIPFIPMNIFDQIIELHTDNELTHSLILFNYQNKLYVYIDLFDTFQCYVLLSEKYNAKKIYQNFCQKTEKKCVANINIKIRSLKDAMILAENYNVPLSQPNKSIEDSFKFIEKTVYESNRKKSYILNYKDVITRKSYVDIAAAFDLNPKDLINYYEAFKFYTIVSPKNPDDHVVNLDLFKMFTIIDGKKGRFFYPEIIPTQSKEEISKYCNAKIKRLAHAIMPKRNL